MLVELMTANSDFATGFHKREKEEVKQFWQEVESKLNSLGPPLKSTFEWKKVWSDQKKYARNKLATNLKEKKATGGGPNMEIKLSTIEETILKLLSTKEAVEGIPKSKVFGMPQTTNKQESVQESIQESIQESLDDILNNIPGEPVPSVHNSPKRNKSKISNADVLQKEIAIQEEMSSNLAGLNESLKTNYPELQLNLKKIYRSIDKLNDLKRRHLKENLRHNFEMEKLRKLEVDSKIEKNKRLIELKELKYKTT